MKVEEIRDNSNKLLGKITTRSDGKLEIRDHNNRLKGIYDPKDNKTRDTNNRPIGNGNILTTLL